MSVSKKHTLQSLFLCLLALLLCVGCQPVAPVDPVNEDTTPAETEQTEAPAPTDAILNGVKLSEYTIVYSDEDLDYSLRAAEYIRDQIKEITDIELTLKEDGNKAEPAAHEIVVGKTNRAISEDLDADTEGVEFAILAKDGHIALEGDYFVIAAAAYFFIHTYVPAEVFDCTVPEEITVHEPIVQKADNVIFMIADGAGYNHTRLLDGMTPPANNDYSDGEDTYYGYLLPAFSFVRTNSLSGLLYGERVPTDSAASGTALSSGHKTKNYVVGIDITTGKPTKSLTEIAGDLGKSTAVLTTDVVTGATPTAFSGHSMDRKDTATIQASQAKTVEKYGTIIEHVPDAYAAEGVAMMEKQVVDTLEKLSKNEKGFFMMYEDHMTDGHSHSSNLNQTFLVVLRFNQIVARCMEYAFYHPNTFVVITADHETGGLIPDGTGGYKYTSGGSHTANYVPLFAYGEGSELFDQDLIENVQIPKTIAKFWGIHIEGNDNGEYPALQEQAK